MHVGASLAFNNPGDAYDDVVLWRSEMALAERVESLGYDSIWVTEHHFTDYSVIPDSLQFLSYVAGRTTNLGLGTMVVVLPWHDPVRVTEQVAALDIMSGGRLLLGIGRGIAEFEFEGLCIPMGESRGRFTECTEILIGALATGSLAYQGQFFQVPERDLRPWPTAPFDGRILAAAISPESIEFVARSGLRMMIIAQKKWDATAADVAAYRSAFQEFQGRSAPGPSAHIVTFCDEDGDRAREIGRDYIKQWYTSTVNHYNLTGDQFAGVNGYDYYDKMSSQLKRHGDGALDFLVDLQVYGTPAECLEQIREIETLIGYDSYIATLSFGGMPEAEARRNVECFGTQVLPSLKQLVPSRAGAST